MKRKVTTTFRWRYQRLADFANPITTVPVRYSHRGESYCPGRPEDVYAIEMSMSSRTNKVRMDFVPVQIYPQGSLHDYRGIVENIEILAHRGVLTRDNDTLDPHGLLAGQLNFICTMVRQKGEQFGETAIRTALAIHEQFGVRNSRECVRQFEFNQVTHVLLDGNWVSYTEYLSKKFHL